MFRFGSPYMLYLLLLIPVMIGLYVVALRARERRIRKFGNPATVMHLMPDASSRRVRNKFILYIIALTFIVLGLARPQFGSKFRERERMGVEMMLVVDVSNSMLAEDFSPNRLESTKMAITRLLNEIDQDKVGLIVFAGDAYVQLPITADYATARSFANRISPNMVSKQGTAIGAAIELAANSYSSNSEGSRVMIIVSDGESHEDDPVAAAKLAADRGITIYAIGVGTPEGKPIMIDGDYIKDENGQMVVSQLNEAMLQQVAILTGGTYIRGSSQNFGLTEITKQIKETQKIKFTESIFEEYGEYFQYMLAIGLFFLIIEMIMLSRKNHILARFNIFSRD